jgi:hypothetical protein
VVTRTLRVGEKCYSSSSFETLATTASSGLSLLLVGAVEDPRFWPGDA